jgi:hypothetical protein
MMIQFVPSETSVAQAPSVAGRIAVPAAPPVKGTTFDALELTDRFSVVFIIISLCL